MEGIIAGGVGAISFFISIVCYCCIRAGAKTPKIRQKDGETGE